MKWRYVENKLYILSKFVSSLLIFLNFNLPLTLLFSDGRDWSIQYGTGSASGFLGKDTVALGDQGLDQLVIPKVTFGQAVHLADFFAGQPLDGILGLAFPRLAVDNVKPVFQEAIDQKLVDKPIFTVWLRKDGADAQGKKGGKFLEVG